MLNEIAYEIFVKERTLHRQLTDDEINQLLAENGLVENIDKMLMLSADDLTTSKEISEKISTTSLSYHLGNDDCKKQIKRIFSVRNSYLHELPEDNILMYKSTQISPAQQVNLQTAILDDCGLSILTTENLSSDKWIDKIVSLTSLLIKIDDKIKVKTLLTYWISGLHYIDIANKMNLPIDDVVEKIEWIRRDFLLASKSILRYISIRFNIQNDVTTDWAYIVEKGLNSKMQLMMMQKGLSDRSALHVIDKQFLNIPITEDKNVLYKFLCERKKEVLDVLANEGLPTFSLMRVNEYLQ